MLPNQKEITNVYNFPSTINEVILSMSDVETREKLYEIDRRNSYLNVASLCKNIRCCGVWEKRNFIQRMKVEQKGKGNSGKMKEKSDIGAFVGLQREKALDNGHFRKDKHRHFRIGIYMYTKKRAKTF